MVALEFEAFPLNDPSAPVTDLKSLDWQRLIWKKIEKRVFNLQKRIYKATIIGQYRSAKSLAKLLLKSSCSILLNTRRVTQDNSGKKTAGIDGVSYLTPNARQKLAKKLMKLATEGWENYVAKPIRNGHEITSRFTTSDLLCNSNRPILCQI